MRCGHRSCAAAPREERLLKLGNEAIDEENFDLARDYQRQLQERGFIGSWELKARLHTAEGEHEEALATVEEALKLIEDDFVLWTQKGNILSDLGRYPLSEKAYARARQCPNAYLPDVDLNEALMSLRRERPETALSLAENVLSEEEAEARHPRARELKVSALVGLGRGDELESFLNTFEEEERSRLWTVASARFDDLGRSDEALNCALKAARLDRKNGDALYHVRESRRAESPSSKAWKLVVLCRSAGMSGYTSYSVVAASPEEGLKLCREVEPDSLELLELESSEVVEAESGLLEGVYNRTGILFFDEEE